MDKQIQCGRSVGLRAQWGELGGGLQTEVGGFNPPTPRKILSCARPAARGMVNIGRSRAQVPDVFGRRIDNKTKSAGAFCPIELLYKSLLEILQNALISA